MKEYLVFALLGLAAGGVYAGLGTGLVFTYRSTGVVNFAYGAIAMCGAFVFTGLHNSGSLDLPVPGLPVLGLGSSHLPTAVAMVGALIFAAFLGWLCHALVFKHLRSSPPFTKVVASVGIMVLLQACAVIRYGSEPATVPNVLPTNSIGVLGQQIPINRFILAAVAVALALVLAAVLRVTRLGLAVRASSQNELSCAYLGWAPSLLSAVAWVSCSVLATLLAIFMAPLTSLTPVSFTLLIVPALAAAAAARFSSFGVCVATGLVLGVGDAILQYAQGTISALKSLSGLQDLLPLIVVVIAVLVRGEAIPRRGSADSGWLPSAAIPKRPVATTTVVVVAVMALYVLTSGEWRYSILVTLAEALLCLSLVVLTGYAGQLSFAQLTVAGLTGYFLSVSSVNWGFPVLPAIVAATLIGAGIGVVVGIPALRFRGVNLAIVTLALAFGVNSLLFQNESFIGGAGGRLIPPLKFLGINFQVSNRHGTYSVTYAGLLLVVVGLAFIAVSRLRNGESGRQFLAVRSNERAAEALGVNVVTVKLKAFALASLLAALGGVALAYNTAGGHEYFAGFDALSSVSVFAFAYLGGIARSSGAAIGSTFVAGSITTYALSQIWSGFQSYNLLLGGIVIVALAVRNPDGIAGTAAHLPRWAKRRDGGTGAGAQPVPAASERAELSSRQGAFG